MRRFENVLIGLFLFFTIGCAEQFNFMKAPGMIKIPAPSVLFSSESLYLENHPVGVTLSPTISVENTGNLEIVNVALSGLEFPWVIAKNECEDPVLPGEVCEIALEFMALEEIVSEIKVTTTATYENGDSHYNDDFFSVSTLRHEFTDRAYQFTVDIQLCYVAFDCADYNENIDFDWGDIEYGGIDTRDLIYMMHFPQYDLEEQVHILNGFAAAMRDYIEEGKYYETLDFDENGWLDAYDLSVLEGLAVVYQAE